MMQETAPLYGMLHAHFLVDGQTMAILTASDSATRWYGYSRQQLLRKSFLELTVEEDAQRLMQRMRRQRETTSMLGIFHQRSAHGSGMKVNLICFRVDVGGRPVRLLVVRILDAPYDRISPESALRRSPTGTSAEQDAYVALLVHRCVAEGLDVQQDLFVNTNRMTPSQPEDARASLQELEEVTRDILRLIEGNRTGIVPQVLNLTRMARRVARRVTLRLRERRFNFVSKKEVVAIADAALAEHLLSILIECVSRFTRACENAEVTLSSSLIDEEYVFVLNCRAHAGSTQAASVRSPDSDGQALDRVQMHLAIARQIVGRHGGRLWVDAVPGTAITIYFTLPQRLLPESSPTMADSGDPLCS